MNRRSLFVVAFAAVASLFGKQFPGLKRLHRRACTNGRSAAALESRKLKLYAIEYAPTDSPAVYAATSLLNAMSAAERDHLFEHSGAPLSYRRIPDDELITYGDECDGGVFTVRAAALAADAIPDSCVLFDANYC